MDGEKHLPLAEASITKEHQFEVGKEYIFTKDGWNLEQAACEGGWSKCIHNI